MVPDYTKIKGKKGHIFINSFPVFWIDESRLKCFVNADRHQEQASLQSDTTRNVPYETKGSRRV